MKRIKYYSVKVRIKVDSSNPNEKIKPVIITGIMSSDKTVTEAVARKEFGSDFTSTILNEGRKIAKGELNVSLSFDIKLLKSDFLISL